MSFTWHYAEKFLTILPTGPVPITSADKSSFAFMNYGYQQNLDNKANAIAFQFNDNKSMLPRIDLMVTLQDKSKPVIMTLNMLDKDKNVIKSAEQEVQLTDGQVSQIIFNTPPEDGQYVIFDLTNLFPQQFVFTIMNYIICPTCKGLCGKTASVFCPGSGTTYECVNSQCDSGYYCNEEQESCIKCNKCNDGNYGCTSLCKSPDRCNLDTGVCECQNNCDNIHCGMPDGCGKTCGCPDGFECQDGKCVQTPKPPCVPVCAPGTCDQSDGCGGTCKCDNDHFCDQGKCVKSSPPSPSTSGTSNSKAIFIVGGLITSVLIIGLIIWLTSRKK